MDLASFLIRQAAMLLNTLAKTAMLPIVSIVIPIHLLNVKNVCLVLFFRKELPINALLLVLMVSIQIIIIFVNLVSKIVKPVIMIFLVMNVIRPSC